MKQSGVIERIEAYKQEPYSAGISEALRDCREAARTAAELAQQQGMTETEVREIAAGAFMAHVPELVTVLHVQAYVACLALALSRGYVSGRDARLCLYTAQLALAAMHKGVQR